MQIHVRIYKACDKPWLPVRKWPLPPLPLMPPPPMPLLVPLAAEVVSEQKGGGGDESEWSVIPLHCVIAIRLKL